MPHPNFVPVRPRLSRSTHRSGVSGATSTDWRLPLAVKTIGGMTRSGRRVSRKLVLRRGRGKAEGLGDVTNRSRPAHERAPLGVDAAGELARARAGLALGDVVEPAARDVGELDVVVLRELAQDVLPDLLLGDATLAWLAQVAQREQHAAVVPARVHSRGEVRVEDHELPRRFPAALLGGSRDLPRI